MKKFLQTLAILLPLLGFSQLWTFSSDNGNWTKKGSGAYSVDAYGATLSGNLYLKITSNHVTTNNFAVLENLVQNLNTPATNLKFLRVKLINNTPATTVTFRADATNPSGANKSATIVANSTSVQEVLIDLTGIIWPGISPSTSTATPGTAGTYELRFQKAGTDFWETTQYIAIDELEFMTDIIKNDHTFDTLDNWVAESNATNNATIAVSGGKLTLSPAGGLNAKAKNDYYSVDASNKYIHILYTNNSTVNNTLRVNYSSPNDSYATIKSLPDQPIATATTGKGAQASVSGEVVIDASSITDWTGTVRKLAVILTYTDGTATVVPASVDTGTLVIDRILINNSSATLSAADIAKAKENLLAYPNPASDVLNFSKKINRAAVYSVTGQMVKTANATDKVDVSKLNKGNYLVKVQLEDGSEQVVKFIKK